MYAKVGKLTQATSSNPLTATPSGALRVANDGDGKYYIEMDGFIAAGITAKVRLGADGPDTCLCTIDGIRIDSKGHIFNPTITIEYEVLSGVCELYSRPHLEVGRQILI